MNLFLAGHEQMDFRSLSDQGFALVVGLGPSSDCDVTMDCCTVRGVDKEIVHRNKEKDREVTLNPQHQNQNSKVPQVSVDPQLEHPGACK